MKIIRKLFNSFKSSLYPNKCVCCGQFIDEDVYISGKLYEQLKQVARESGLFLRKNEKSEQKRGSHKEVWFFLVGTGVLDGPKRHNCSAVDKDNPDRF